MLCNEYDKLNMKFLPQTIYVDFEEAIHYSILSVWPETNIKGCRFHLGQSWWRKIQNSGLTNEYKSDFEFSKYFKFFFGLAFLHPEEVGDCFTEAPFGPYLPSPLNLRVARGRISYPAVPPLRISRANRPPLSRVFIDKFFENSSFSPFREVQPPR